HQPCRNGRLHRVAERGGDRSEVKQPERSVPQRRRLENARKARSKGGGHGVKSSAIAVLACRARSFSPRNADKNFCRSTWHWAFWTTSLTTPDRHGSIAGSR